MHNTLFWHTWNLLHEVARHILETIWKPIDDQALDTLGEGGGLRWHLTNHMSHRRCGIQESVIESNALSLGCVHGSQSIPNHATTPVVATNFCATQYLSLKGVGMSWSKFNSIEYEWLIKLTVGFRLHACLVATIINFGYQGFSFCNR